MIEGPRISSSFRDPSGYVFTHEGVLYRQIQPIAEKDFRLYLSSGLHSELTQAGLAIEFEELSRSGSGTVIKPERIPTISYPYEWSFGQLKDAALSTLDIARRALERGMSLKDASAYNIQFKGYQPVFIDTLSFEEYKEGEPWVAYKQFCQHFLAPLAIMAHCDIRLGSLLETNIDGIPLDLAAGLLPGKTKLNPGLLTHLHLHAKASQSQGKSTGKSLHVSKMSLFALIDSLKGAVTGLNWNPEGTEWSNYYAETNYSDESFREKQTLVGKYLDDLVSTCSTCWDLGANNGAFSQIAILKGFYTVAWDIDPAAVELAYRHAKKNQQSKLLPLLQDLRNPSTNLGWGGKERDSLAGRGPADVLLALALIHHIAIGNNVPQPMVAQFFAEIGRYLIIEFVPKEDSQVQRMLVARKDIFDEYHQDGFEAAFGQFFTITAKQSISGTHRTLYLMTRKS